MCICPTSTPSSTVCPWRHWARCSCSVAASTRWWTRGSGVGATSCTATRGRPCGWRRCCWRWPWRWALRPCFFRPRRLCRPRVCWFGWVQRSRSATWPTAGWASCTRPGRRAKAAGALRKAAGSPGVRALRWWGCCWRLPCPRCGAGGRRRPCSCSCWRWAYSFGGGLRAAPLHRPLRWCPSMRWAAFGSPGSTRAFAVC